MTRKLSMLACGIVVAGLIGCAIQLEMRQRAGFGKGATFLGPSPTNTAHTNIPIQQSEGAP